MTDITSLAARNTELAQTQRQIHDELRANAKQLRAACKHPALVEKPYRPSGVISYAQAPQRMCTTCGAYEDGWSAGFQVLRDSQERAVRHVSAEQYHELVPPGGSQKWAWCYGSAITRGHPCAANNLKAGRMDGKADGEPTRCCEEHTGDWVSPMRTLKQIADHPDTTERRIIARLQDDCRARYDGSDLYSSPEFARYEVTSIAGQTPHEMQWLQGCGFASVSAQGHWRVTEAGAIKLTEFTL